MPKDAEVEKVGLIFIALDCVLCRLLQEFLIDLGLEEFEALVTLPMLDHHIDVLILIDRHIVKRDCGL